MKELLIEINILSKPPRKGVSEDDSLYKKILRLMTPVQSKKPILSYRNIMALFYAVFNVHEDWMDKQDPFEFVHRENSYQRRIWKYKLMINKLNSNAQEALT